jgi:predicted dehydrogenase
VEVRALCSRRRARSEALARELGLPDSALEERWEALVGRDDVDLVVNTAPDYLHHPITMAAIAHRKHVFCEKPLAMNAAQAREMLDAAERVGIAHFTGFTWRFAPPFATVRRLIERGTLGRVWLIDGHFRIGPPLPGKEWQLDPEQRAGGVLSNLGVHLIDLVRFLAGPGIEPPAPGERSWCVWAHSEALGGHVERPGGPAGGVQDVCWLQLDLALTSRPAPQTRPAAGLAAATDGRPAPPASLHARLQVSQLPTLRASDPVRVEVHGTAATAIGYANPLAPQRQRVALIERTSEAPRPVEPLEYLGGPPAPPTAALPSGGLLRPTIKHLYEAHIVPRLRGAPPAAGDTPTFRDGWIAQRVLDAALRSAAGGGWVAV